MASKRRRQKQSSMAPILLIAGGVLLVIAILIYGAISGRTDPQTAQDIPFPDIQRVSLQDSRAALDGQQAVFLDVRSAEQFAASHIPGALNIPVTELEGRLNELDPSQWIITYCT